MEPLTLAIGLGLVFGLIVVDWFGLYAGGMVVPGYIALNLNHGVTICLTLFLSLVIFLIMQFLSTFLIIYGRRRIALIVLISFLLTECTRCILSQYEVASQIGGLYTVIGYIIPGLIALAMDRQGIVETVSALLIVSVLVRLVLIVWIGPVLVAL